jgi:AbrB family looped-hinge helix DNA binding protein
MPVATLTSKGQITIPKEIREQLQVQTGDRIEFLIGTNGQVIIYPATSNVTTLKGLIPKPRRPVKLAAMKGAIRQRGARA